LKTVRETTKKSKIFMIMKNSALEIAADELYITADRFSTLPAYGGGAADPAERQMDTS